MDWASVVDGIKKVAPMVGTLIGGPVGAIVGAGAGSVISMVASALGVEPTQDAITSAISADPQALLKLKELEYTHKETLEKLVLDREKLDVEREHDILADKQSARKRDELYITAGKTNVRANVMLIAAFTAVIVMATVIILFCAGMSDLVIGSLLTIIGAFVKDIGTAFDFEFGSSRGSNEKNDVMASMKVALTNATNKVTS